MSTFLQLCQKVARDSGVIPGVQPSTTQNQSGVLLKVVSWTAEAYRRIQNKEAAWKWMQGEFSGNTTAGAPRYTSGSWNITDWAEWVGDPKEYFDYPTSIYKTATGVSDEGYIVEMPFERWRQRFARGAQVNDRPSWYAISPAGEFCLGPIPSDIFTVKGIYRKTVQELTQDTDVPTMPARFHDIIAYDAGKLLAGSDEAAFAFADATAKRNELWDALTRDQLPQVVIRGETLA